MPAIFFKMSVERGQAGRHVLKFERLRMPMRRFQLSLILTPRDADLNQ